MGEIPEGAHDPRGNRLLNALRAEELAWLMPHLEWVPMPLGETLLEPARPFHTLYFPTTAIVSLLYVLKNGASAEIAVVGNDGMVGASLLIGSDITTSYAVTQSAGHGYRIEARLLREAFRRGTIGSGPSILQPLLLRYVQALLTQMAQTAVCNRYHSVAQQMCRWLLLRLDRLPGEELIATQEQIANLLGVRREGITEAAGALHLAGVIDYRRGHITVHDRARLEARACECYSVVKKESNRLLSR